MYKNDLDDEFWDLSDYAKKREEQPVREKREIALSEVSFSAKTRETDAYAPIALPSRGAARVPVRARDTVTHSESYVPQNPLILSVAVSYKSSEQSFYRLFREDARRYHRERGKASNAPYVPFFSYVPQFSQLSASQKAYYLYFRDELEGGNPIKADEAYFMLYVYELLNLTDVISPSVICSRIAYAYSVYRAQFPRTDKYVAQWLLDLCLLFHLPPPTAELAPCLSHVLRASGVPEFFLGDVTGQSDEGVLALVLSLSAYDYRAHKCGMENADLFARHMTAAMKCALPLLLEKGRAGGTSEVRHLAFSAFAGSICAHNLRADIELDYRPFGLSHALGAAVTAAIKYVENALRAHLCIRNRLRITELDAGVQAVLDGYIARALPKKAKASVMAGDDHAYRALYEASEQGISFSRAGEIEQCSWENARLLGAQEEAEATVDPLPLPSVMEVPEKAEKAEDAEIQSPLSSEAKAYLAAILECKEKITHKARLIEEINAYAEAHIGDVLLLPSASVFGAFELIEDYKEDAWSFIR